jgi:hypothetical protein
MRIYVGGHVFGGTPVQILTAMKHVAHGVDELDLHAYIDWIIQRAAWVDGICLDVEAGTLHERAASLLEQMMDAGLAMDDAVDGVTSERPTAVWRATAAVDA